MLIIPSFAPSEGEGGHRASAHAGVNSQLPESLTALLHVTV